MKALAMRFLFSVGSATILFAPLSARGLVLCAHKSSTGNVSGTVKVRSTCRTHEVQLDPLALSGRQIIAGTIGGDDSRCTPLTDPNVPGTCPILGGSGFS